MTREKTFLLIQSLLCVLAAGLLAAGALSLYFEGAARQAEGDLFFYMYTRERAGAKLLPVLPVFCCSLGLSVAGRILGIGRETGEPLLRNEKLPRDPGIIREKAVRQRADRKTLIIRTAVLAAALLLIVLGIVNGGFEDVLAKGAAVCTECVGLG